MSSQNSGVNSSRPLVLSSGGKYLEAETIITEATRTVPLSQYTLMGKIAASSKWTPITNTTLTNTDGSQVPQGIYMGDDIPAATLAAGDVANVPILVADALVDASLVVFGKGPTGALATISAASVITMATGLPKRIDDALAERNIFFDQTVAIDGSEN
jgi:hypothetical protein